MRPILLQYPALSAPVLATAEPEVITPDKWLPQLGHLFQRSPWPAGQVYAANLDPIQNPVTLDWLVEPGRVTPLPRSFPSESVAHIEPIQNPMLALDWAVEPARVTLLRRLFLAQFTANLDPIQNPVTLDWLPELGNANLVRRSWIGDFSTNVEPISNELIVAHAPGIAIVETILLQYQALAEPINTDPETVTVDKFAPELGHIIRKRPAQPGLAVANLDPIANPAEVFLDWLVQPDRIPARRQARVQDFAANIEPIPAGTQTLDWEPVTADVHRRKFAYPGQFVSVVDPLPDAVVYMAWWAEPVPMPIRARRMLSDLYPIGDFTQNVEPIPAENFVSPHAPGITITETVLVQYQAFTAPVVIIPEAVPDHGWNRETVQLPRRFKRNLKGHFTQNLDPIPVPAPDSGWQQTHQLPVRLKRNHTGIFVFDPIPNPIAPQDWNREIAQRRQDPLKYKQWREGHFSMPLEPQPNIIDFDFDWYLPPTRPVFRKPSQSVGPIEPLSVPETPFGWTRDTDQLPVRYRPRLPGWFAQPYQPVAEALPLFDWYVEPSRPLRLPVRRDSGSMTPQVDDAAPVGWWVPETALVRRREPVRTGLSVLLGPPIPPTSTLIDCCLDIDFTLDDAIDFDFELEQTIDFDFDCGCGEMEGT